MKLSISNIAWDPEQDQARYTALRDRSFQGLEGAPTRFFPERPYDHLEEAAALAARLKAEYGLCVPSLQSIWFGRTENLFASPQERAALLDYTRRTMDFAAALHCGNLVFGCPRNRATHGREDRAAAFFDDQAKVIDALKDFPNTEKTVAFFYVSTDGSVVVRNANDYVAGMIELAGGRYIYGDPARLDSPRASVSVSMEDFYAAAVDADYLIYNASIDAPLNSVADLLGKSSLFADFKAVKEGNVWSTDKYLYQATDIVGELITDINRMLTGETEGMTFIRKLA